MTDRNELKILIADDEPLAAERLQMLLARIEGVHLVGTAHDGESAVRMAEALEPDLVLLDIAMPGLDGIEVARALVAPAANRRPLCSSPRSTSSRSPHSTLRRSTI